MYLMDDMWKKLRAKSMKDNQSLLKNRDKLVKEMINCKKQIQKIDQILTERRAKECLVITPKKN
jgi:hypothetical protein